VRSGETPIEILDARIVDLGGGGAKLALAESLRPGERVALAIRARSDRGDTLRVTFDCRVAWSSGGMAGVMFAGSPSTSLADP
jgi:hypothetical protein